MTFHSPLQVTRFVAANIAAAGQCKVDFSAVKNIKEILKQDVLSNYARKLRISLVLAREQRCDVVISVSPLDCYFVFIVVHARSFFVPPFLPISTSSFGFSQHSICFKHTK